MKQSEINLLRGVFGNIFGRLSTLELEMDTVESGLLTLQNTIDNIPPTLTDAEVRVIIDDWITTTFPTFGATDVPDYQP